MAHGIVRHIVLHLEIVHTVNSHGTVVRLMNGIVAHVRLVHGANHVEMDGVSSELEGLTDVSELDVLNATDDGFILQSTSKCV